MIIESLKVLKELIDQQSQEIANRKALLSKSNNFEASNSNK
jgi:hypothetical protein